MEPFMCILPHYMRLKTSYLLWSLKHTKQPHLIGAIEMWGTKGMTEHCHCYTNTFDGQEWLAKH